MKTTLVYLAFSIFLMNSTTGNIPYSGKMTLENWKSQEASLKNTHQIDSLLNNIQQKVMDAFVQGKISQSDKSLVYLKQEILKQNNNNNNNSLLIYWYSYACYYHSILLMITNDKKGSEKILNEGITLLNKLNLKNSEHMALLALMESFSIHYISGMEAPLISERVKQSAEKALQLDSLNLRAYYVLGSNDFYAPEQYGGGKNAEGYLLKAIQLNDQSVPNPYLPSWGKNSAYEMLIRFYINHKQYSEAKKYHQKAIALFPGDYMINKLTDELANH